MQSIDVLFLVVIIAAIVWVAISQSKGAKNRRAAARDQASIARGQASIEAHARAIQQWQAAYALANPGQPIPMPPLTLAGDVYGASSRTNTMSILAIIFGFLVSILGIVFGHIALAQIRRTGEAGRGLAITGLVFGYLGVVSAIVVVIVELAQIN